jgi:hypothetical protein
MSLRSQDYNYSCVYILLVRSDFIIPDVQLLSITFLQNGTYLYDIDKL